MPDRPLKHASPQNDYLHASKCLLNSGTQGSAISIVKLIMMRLQAERSKIQAQLAETREVARELKAQIEDKEMTLNPYQAEKKAAFQERETQRLGR